MPPRYEVIGVEGLPEIGRGDDLAGFIHETARRQQTPLESRDILVVSQKIVSKTEGRLVRLSEVTPRGSIPWRIAPTARPSPPWKTIKYGCGMPLRARLSANR